MKHLKQFPGKRWLISIAICNLYFNLFGLNDEQRISFCASLFENYSKEFNYSKRTKMALDNKYRSYSQELTHALLVRDNQFFSNELLEFYESEASIVIYQIRGILNLKNQVQVAELLSSILHMHFNRLFKNQQRMQEFVVYYFLNKLYKSIKARKLINE
jgi:thiopeptide-type bacteriocin biosynthesis protein